MELTPNERFPYPDGNDPGNGALDLQILAEAIDAKVVTMLANFKSAINKLMRVTVALGTGPNAVTANAFSDIFTIGAGQWSKIYDSTGQATLDPASMNGFGTTPGIFRMGCCLATNPTGTVNGGTFRELRLSATVPLNDPSVFPLTTTIKRSLSKVYEASAGNTLQCCELEFATAFPRSTTLNMEFQHGNTGSNVTTLAGTLMYVYRIGDIEVL